MKLYDLKTLHMTKAFGIDQIPEFSWKLQSRKRDVIQKAYRILVYDEGQVVWDSGIVESREQSFIEYKGKSLRSRGSYTWNVTVWNNYEETASAEASFETAFLSRHDWRASWISSTIERVPATSYKYGDTFPPILFQRKFPLRKGKISKARLYATSYGNYQVFINGQRPDDREFAPEFTVYHDILYYQTYDVAELLKAEENDISMYVADGWYFSGQTGPCEKKIARPSVLYQLEVTYEDGGTEVVCSDGSESCATDYIVYSDLFQGEKQDFSGACQGRHPVERQDYGFQMLRAQPMPPVRPYELIPAAEVITTPRGEQVVDFGQVLCGRARIRIDAPKGTELVFEYFEILDEDGNYINTMFAPQKDIVVAGEGSLVHEAKFTFHGFRYIRVSGISHVRKEDFTAVALSTEKEDQGSFDCSDPRLNRLYQNVRWSQRNNMISVPTDCPSREKAGWTGDILIYAKTALMNENMTPFLSSWLNNVMADQQEDGTVMITTPFANLYSNLVKAQCASFGDEKPTGVAGWSDAIVWVPYMMYQVTGNQRILKHTYTAMNNWCSYIIRTAREKRGDQGFPEEYDQYLWNTGFHFGEWLIPSRGDVPGFEICKESSFYIAPFFGYKTLVMMSEICRVLEDREKTDYYEDMAGKMKHAIQRTLFEQDLLPRDLMGAYVIAFAFDLVPESFREEYKNRLVTLIHENHGCLDTGFLATPFLLDSLEKVGEKELAHSLLWQNKLPSWLYEVEHGATCIWEAWEADEARKTGRFVSFDHYAFGCVDDWICRKLCGIDSDTPGFSHIVIAPELDDRLTYCSRSFESEAGEVRVRWTHKKLEVAVPCNATATVSWMGNTYETGSGEYTWEA